jgi:hypothetical protein
MEIHVSPLNATRAQRLAQRLARVPEAMSVSFDAGRRNLRVLTGIESTEAVVVVVDTVHAWLAEDGAGAGPARLSVGERFLRLGRLGHRAGTHTH